MSAAKKAGLGFAVATLGMQAAAGASPPVFRPADRAVSTWRGEAAKNLVVSATLSQALRGDGPSPAVARCVKLNNYWCIKKAGWNGEIAADGEGHVAFASAEEGAAVAALLLKRYYVDFGRRTAIAIVSRWAPAQCGLGSVSLAGGLRSLAPKGLGGTLRARWLVGHSRGFALARPGARPPKRSTVAARVSRPMPAPTIAVGLGEGGPTKPMRLEALLQAASDPSPSRASLSSPGKDSVPSVSSCGGDSPRIAAYAVKASTGIATGADGDLELFAPDGAPKPNLTAVMNNMARVEIGPLGPTSQLVAAGIAAAFRPGRNP